MLHALDAAVPRLRHRVRSCSSIGADPGCCVCSVRHMLTEHSRNVFCQRVSDCLLYTLF